MKRLTYRRLASIAGYLVLGAFTFALYGAGLFESFDHTLIVTVVLGLCILGLIYEGTREWRSAYSADSEEQRFDLPRDTLSLFSVFFGALITYWISIDLGQGAVVASGLVGIFAAAFLKPYAVPIFCGSFVGMASRDLLVYYPGLMAAAAIAGGIFVLAKHVFNGFGGKLGTIAFAGCILAATLTGSPFLSSPIPGWDAGWLLIVYCVVAAVVTFVLSVWFGQGPVMASGMVGLAGGLLLPAIHGDIGGLLAIGVFSASFAGMSGTERFEKAYWMIPAGLLCALIIMFTSPFAGGAGGKLGTAAFGAVIGVRGLMVIGMHLQNLTGSREDDAPVPNS